MPGAPPLAAQDDGSRPDRSPLVPPAGLDRLRAALGDFTVDGIHQRLGLVGRAAHERGDLHAVDRALPTGDRVATLVRLFLLGRAVPEAEARAALHPLDLADATALVECSTGSVRARIEVRPYADDSAAPWWVCSDFGSDVTGLPLAADHVLGIGSASLTLAQAVPRSRVPRALDLGTGCGIQALHLAGHTSAVVATDVSGRALRMAATTAALSGQRWDLRCGSLLDPVADERFDLVVANPPFVVSPGLGRDAGGYDYRDSGLAGDGVSAALLQGLPDRLTDEGTAVLLANWQIPSGGDWAERVSAWLAGRGVDAWVWQREVVDPSQYVSLWLRDAGEQPGSARWVQRYDAWLDWFTAAGVAAVGMGLVTLWRGAADDPAIVCEDVPQVIEQPAGPHIATWVHRQRWLAAHDDAALRAARLRCVEGVVRTRHDLRTADGWQTELSVLRQAHGMRWELETDDAIAGLVAACSGAVPLEAPLQVLAAWSDRPVGEVAVAVLPVVRDLIARGFLEPVAS